MATKTQLLESIQLRQNLCEMTSVPFKRFDRVMRKHVNPDNGFVDDQLMKLSVEKLQTLLDSLEKLLHPK